MNSLIVLYTSICCSKCTNAIIRQRSVDSSSCFVKTHEILMNHRALWYLGFVSLAFYGCMDCEQNCLQEYQQCEYEQCGQNNIFVLNKPTSTVIILIIYFVVQCLFVESGSCHSLLKLRRNMQQNFSIIIYCHSFSQKPCPGPAHF